MIDHEQEIIISMMQQINFKQHDQMLDQSYQLMENAKQKNTIEDVKQPIYMHSFLKTNQLQNKCEQSNLQIKNKLTYQNEILSKYFKLVTGRQSLFSFVQALPHTTNLKSNYKFQVGEHIVSIPFNFMISEQVFMKAKINKYLQKINNLVELKQNIFKTSVQNQRGIHMRMIEEDLLKIIQLKSVLYLFQTYFVRQITNQSPSYQDSQWLYFQLLPKDFSYLPIRYWKQIGEFHPAISKYLEDKQLNIIQTFNDVKLFMSHDFLKIQYSFLTFLMSQLGIGNGKQWYEKFMSAFTTKNYLFAIQCQRTRIYNNEDSQQQMLLPKKILSNNHKKKVFKQSAFIPILDLFHHSYKNANLKWIFNPINKAIDIIAMKSISSGDQLYICYNSMPIQNQMVEYGFVDIDSECYLGICLGVNQDLMIAIIEKTLNKNLDSHLHKLIKTFLGLNFKNITLGLTSNKIQQFQKTGNLMEILIQFIWNELVMFANNMISLLQKENNNLTKNNASINYGCRSSILQNHLQRSFIHAVNQDIHKKQNHIQNLKYNIHMLNYTENNNFNLIYTMRCLLTVLISQLKWLSFIKSKFNIL